MKYHALKITYENLSYTSRGVKTEPPESSKELCSVFFSHVHTVYFSINIRLMWTTNVNTVDKGPFNLIPHLEMLCEHFKFHEIVVVSHNSWMFKYWVWNWLTQMNTWLWSFNCKRRVATRYVVTRRGWRANHVCSTYKWDS